MSVSPSSDFVIVGVAESADELGLGLNAVKNALLEGYHNPRRALLRHVMLTSDVKRCTDFILPMGDGVLSSKVLSGEDLAWLKSTYASVRDGCSLNSGTDFVVLGEAEHDGEHDVGLGAIRTSLLGGHHNPRRTLLRPIALSSDHKGCTDFFVTRSEHGLLCSKALTSADVLWFERKVGLKPGKLFAAFGRATREEPSATELPWEPMARYNATARSMRSMRGSKSVEHLRNLRASDPTINLSGWLDWGELHSRVRASRLAQLNAQAMIDRAMAGHRVATRQAQRTSATHASVIKQPRAAPQPPKQPPKQPPDESYMDAKQERKSADSVISFLEPPFFKPAYEPVSPSSILDGNVAGAPPGAWSLDKGLVGFGSASYSEKVKGSARINAKGTSYGDEVKKTEQEEVVWFEGVAYIKSDDGVGGYSSS